MEIFNDFSGQLVGPIFKGQAVKMERRPQTYGGRKRKCARKI